MLFLTSLLPVTLLFFLPTSTAQHGDDHAQVRRAPDLVPIADASLESVAAALTVLQEIGNATTPGASVSKLEVSLPKLVDQTTESERRRKKKSRCPAKKKGGSNSKKAKHSTTKKIEHSITSSKHHTTTTSVHAAKASKGASGVADPATYGAGLFGIVSHTCGPSGANDEHPNGAESWLACGISSHKPDSGWTPPAGVTISKLKTVSMETALSQNSVWEPCRRFTSLFEKYGAQYNLPPILLASIALQESTCNPHESGDNGGAVGLMQITVDKCGGRSHSDCADPDYNIKTGAAYLASQLQEAGGNVLVALGSYNGWFAGMSYATATAAAYSGCCECQQNLDYLFQMLNGWILGKTGYSLGSFGNLKVCGNDSK